MFNERFPSRTYDAWRTRGPDELPDFNCAVCDVNSEDCTCEDGPTEPEPPEEEDRRDELRETAELFCARKQP